MFKKSILLCGIAIALLSFGCSNSGGSINKNIDTLEPVNFIIPDSQEHPFLFSNLDENLMTIDGGKKYKTVVIKSGSGYSEVLFDQNGSLKEVFNPLSGHQVISIVISNRPYLLMYDRKKRFISGVTVFEKNYKIWIADINISADFSAQLRALFLSGADASLSIMTDLDSGIGDIRQVDSNIVDFARLLTKPVEHKSPNQKDVFADVRLAAQHTAIAIIDVGFGSFVDESHASEVTREFAAAALATIGLKVLSDEKKSLDLLRCFSDVSICKKNSKDSVVHSNMALFGGLLSNDSNSEILRSILNASRLRWNMLAGSTYRFFDPKIDSMPPSFKSLDE